MTAERTVRAPGIAAAGSLVVVAAAVFCVPALLGHPVVPGDDLTQNLPLRQLVGRDLAAGHLPVFDPALWSGTPLLAGWNAGAAYPLTWLFAVLPAQAAWALGLTATYAVAGTGCYAFLRANGLGVAASWLGGFTFEWGGAMAAQVPHFGLVAGMSWVPVALVCVLRLSAPGALGPGRRAGWTAALAASVGMLVLAGEPRAVSDGAAVLGCYALYRLGRLALTARRRRGGRVRTLAPPVAAVVLGGAVGVALGAVQLLPGLAAVAISQRAQVTAQLFSSGSLPVRWLLLLLVPNVLGGSGSLGTPHWFAPYTLTEVAASAGVLPLMAVAGLPARLRRRGGVPEWAVWYLIGALGILMALGSTTPLWQLLIHVPLYGGQRLSTRALLVTDLALAVLLGFWVDGLVHRAPAPSERLAAGVPAVATVAVAAAGILDGPGLARWMGVGAPAASRAARLGPALSPFLALALAALGALWILPLVRARWRAGMLGTLGTVDLLAFALMVVVAAPLPATPGGAAPGAAREPSPVRPPAGPARPLASLRLTGRFAVYDPGLLDQSALRHLGVPDRNVLDGTWSVGGYGSIVDGRYARRTGTHGVSGTGQDVFSPAAATDGVLDALDTELVVTPATSLVTARPPDRPGGPGTRPAAAGQPVTWELGPPTVVRAVAVAPERVPGGGGSAAGAPGTVQLGLVTPAGRTTWLATAADGGGWAAFPPRPETAVAVVARSSRAGVLAPASVVSGDAREVADGPLASAMVPPHWAYAGTDGPFALYRDRRRAGPVWLATLPGRRAGSALSWSGRALVPSTVRVSSASGALVARSMANIPGWTSSWQPAGGGSAVPLPVHRLGVVQVVRVPPGTGTLTFGYRAPWLVTGAALSAGALATVLSLTGAAAVVATRRRQAAVTVTSVPSVV